MTGLRVGGGGGGGGGIILISANSIKAEPGSSISATGGNGGDGEDPTAGITAGGGGGGGGVIYVFTNGTSTSIQWTPNISGGLKGSSQNIGLDGADGHYYLQASNS